MEALESGKKTKNTRKIFIIRFKQLKFFNYCDMHEKLFLSSTH